MVRELERERQKSDFPETAPAANPVFFRTYSRRTETGRETWDEVCDLFIRRLSQFSQMIPIATALRDSIQRL